MWRGCVAAVAVVAGEEREAAEPDDEAAAWRELVLVVLLMPACAAAADGPSVDMIEWRMLYVSVQGANDENGNLGGLSPIFASHFSHTLPRMAHAGDHA